MGKLYYSFNKLTAAAFLILIARLRMIFFRNYLDMKSSSIDYSSGNLSKNMIRSIAILADKFGLKNFYSKYIILFISKRFASALMINIAWKAQSLTNLKNQTAC